MVFPKIEIFYHDFDIEADVRKFVYFNPAPILYYHEDEEDPLFTFITTVGGDCLYACMPVNEFERVLADFYVRPNRN